MAAQLLLRADTEIDALQMPAVIVDIVLAADLPVRDDVDARRDLI